MIEIQYMVWLSWPSLQWQNPSLAQCQISQACALSRAALANADSESKTSCKLLGMPAMIWHPEDALDTLSCHQYSHFDKSLGLWLLSSQCHWCPPTLRCDLCAKSGAALIAEFLEGLHSCTSWMRGWSRKILSSSQKNLKSLRSSHQNNVQSSLGTPCARSFIKSCIWVFAQAWTSECPNDHQPFWKVLQKVVRSAQNAFNVSHCKQWRQGRQQEQQVGRKCLIQHIHNWSITPRVRRLPAIQLRPATVSCPPCLQLKTRRLRKFQALALPQLNVAGRGLIVFQQVPDITTLCNREVPCCTQPKKKAYSRIQLSV